MKQNTNTVTVSSTNPTVLDVVNAARKNNPDGSIQIDELQKKLKLSRFEVVQQCREIDKGDIAIKVGRKGGKSEILYGSAAINFRANRHTNSKKINSPRKIAPQNINVFECLRLHVAGNQTIDLPIQSTELVNA